MMNAHGYVRFDQNKAATAKGLPAQNFDSLDSFPAYTEKDDVGVPMEIVYWCGWV